MQANLSRKSGEEMYKAYFKDSDQRIELMSERSLLYSLQRCGVRLPSPCGGKGSCGKCKVRISDGGKENLTSTEKVLLKKEELDRGIRLACCIFPQGDMELEIPGEEKHYKTLTAGSMPDFTRHRGREGEEWRGGYGVALDIGTTTLVIGIAEAGSGREILQMAEVNPQMRFGSDILSRISHEAEAEKTGKRELHSVLISALNSMFEEACKGLGIKKNEITSMVVSANCTMMHTFLGMSTAPIGRAPFRPVYTEAVCKSPAELGLKLAGETEIYCIPGVSAHIGPDIVSGSYAAGMFQSRENILLIDIGTNSELVLRSGEKIFCCSCAAGPALEGMNISIGMLAAEGAIEEIEIGEGGIRCSVIGGGMPKGFCGSGILALTRELLRTGMLKKSGAFLKQECLEEGDYRKKFLHCCKGKRSFLIQGEDPALEISQKDIRQVQLAKGAIFSAVRVLLNKAKIQAGELKHVIIAGQFGRYVEESSLIRTGLLPQEAEGKILYGENISKSGAYMALLSSAARKEMEELAKHMEYIELSLEEGYERIFLESLPFPDMDGGIA